MYTIDKLRKKIAEGKLLVGCNSMLSDPSISELYGLCGCDYVWIDMEHAPLDYAATQQHIIAAQAGGASAFVRVPWVDLVWTKRIIDMGPNAIIFPMIRTAEDAKNAIAYCLYPPEGVRGWNPVRASKYGTLDVEWYRDNIKNNMWRIILIEHIDAVNNIDAILDVEGIDAIILGPSDLSGSMGCLLDIYSDEVQNKLTYVAKKAREKGILVGADIRAGTSAEKMKVWIDKGISFISVGQDVHLLSDGVKANMETIKHALALE